jgi:hypothetical protein
MKRLAILAVAAALAAPPAFAVTTADLKPAFSNTIVSTYPDGRKAKLWLNADGSYRAQGRRGKPSSGTWSLKGERICLKQHRPFRAPSYCTDVRKGGVGTSWTSKAVTGERIRVQVVAGR